MSEVADAAQGEMAQIWAALIPAIILCAWFIGGMAVYAVRRARYGDWHDAELEARGATPILGHSMRNYFSWVTRPFWLLIRASCLPPDAITTLSMLLALGSGAALAGGRFALGGWLYIASGILDVFDGRLARETGRSSPAGAALDSILDRYADVAVLAGIAWYYRESWVLAVALTAMAGGFLTSYIRARGESLGVQVRGGLMQRAERIVCLGATTALAPVVAAVYETPGPHQMHWLAVGGLIILAFSSQWTAAQRFVMVMRALGADRPPRLSTRRDSLFRGLAVAFTATAADFVVVVLLVQSAGMAPWSATAVGCVVGAAASFTIGRRWAFANDGAAGPQMWRYALVSVTSMGLNAGGVAVLLVLPINYTIAWVAVRGAVFLLWNFPLHRDYVFTQSEPALPAAVVRSR